MSHRLTAIALSVLLAVGILFGLADVWPAVAAVGMASTLLIGLATSYRRAVDAEGRAEFWRREAAKARAAWVRLLVDLHNRRTETAPASSSMGVTSPARPPATTST